MFKPGDIIEMNRDVPYSVTTPGTKWMIYSFIDNDKVRIGKLPQGDHSPEDMIRLYGGYSMRDVNRRYEANIRMFTVYMHEIKISGNNAIFKNKLLQGDMWEEEKKTGTKFKFSGYYRESDDDNLESPFLSNSDLPF